MISVELKNVQVIAANAQTVQLNAGQRMKQDVLMSCQTSRGVEMLQAEVWDEQIARLNIQPGEFFTSSMCGLIGRQSKGRWFYSLSLFKVVRSDELNYPAQDAQDDVEF